MTCVAINAGKSTASPSAGPVSLVDPPAFSCWGWNVGHNGKTHSALRSATVASEAHLPRSGRETEGWCCVDSASRMIFGLGSCLRSRTRLGHHWIFLVAKAPPLCIVRPLRRRTRAPCPLTKTTPRPLSPRPPRTSLMPVHRRRRSGGKCRSVGSPSPLRSGVERLPEAIEQTVASVLAELARPGAPTRRLQALRVWIFRTRLGCVLARGQSGQSNTVSRRTVLGIDPHFFS